MRGYFDEVRSQPRPLIGTALGLGSGLASIHFLTGIFVPHLIGEFGWTRSDFALVSSVGVVVMLVLPFYGRLADVYGVRRVAIWGVLCQPLGYTALSLQTGDIREYLAIFVFLLVGGCATTAAVYGRIIMERYSRARGLALAIVMSAAPLLCALGAPVLNAVIEDYGWRAAYRVVAVVLGLLGLIALSLIPATTKTLKDLTKSKSGSFRDYPLFLRSPAFLLIFFGMIFNNISQILNASQLGLLLADNGAVGGVAARVLSVYAIGVIVGRFFCGLALDRFRPHIVAAVILAMPAVGQLLLASHWDATLVLMISLLLMGLATGAEGDVAAFLVMKYFPSRIFGSVNSIVSAGAGASMGAGGLFLSLSFQFTPGFDLFLTVSAASVLFGSLLFLFLGRCRPLDEEAIEAALRRRDGGVAEGTRAFARPAEARH